MKKLLIAISAIVLFSTFAHAELTKETVVDKMEVLENGTIQVRQAIRIIEDGQVISQKYHRYVVTPGQDVSDKDQKVQDLAANLWNQEVIDNYMQQTGQELTLDQKKAIKTRQLYANIKKFINTLPNGMPRYDDDLKLGLMSAIMEAMAQGQQPPEKVMAAKQWLQTVQGLFVTRKAEIADAQDEYAYDVVDVSVTTLEWGYGRNGTIFADPGVSTSDLVQ